MSIFSSVKSSIEKRGNRKCSAKAEASKKLNASEWMKNVYYTVNGFSPWVQLKRCEKTISLYILVRWEKAITQIFNKFPYGELFDVDYNYLSFSVYLSILDHPQTFSLCFIDKSFGRVCPSFQSLRMLCKLSKYFTKIAYNESDHKNIYLQ